MTTTGLTPGRENTEELLQAGAPKAPPGGEPLSSSPQALACDSSKCSSRAFEIASIAPILNSGFRQVLAEANKLGVLDPPHGRTPMPDPKKIVEDNPSSSDGEEGGNNRQKETPSGAEVNGGNDDDDDDDKLLEYKFDYGFNPLVFLGEYMRRNNPVAIRARKEQHMADLRYLRQRAAKCLERETAKVELHELVVHRRSGIVHGPVVGEVSDCGGIVWARAIHSGNAGSQLHVVFPTSHYFPLTGLIII